MCCKWYFNFKGYNLLRKDGDSKNGSTNNSFQKSERNIRMKNINAEVMQSVAGHGERSNEGNFMDRALQRHMKAIVNNGLDN